MLHEYEFAVAAVNTAFCPLHIVGLLTVTVGVAVTLTVMVVVAVQVPTEPFRV